MSVELTNQKETGSYYTPPLLADFMVYHIFDKRNFILPENVSILEPSAGDGIFFKSILRNETFSSRPEFTLP